MSITEYSTKALWMAVLAIVAIVLAGWRKPARAARRMPRDPRRSTDVGPVSSPPSERYRPAGPIRRLAAGTGLAAVASVSGALIAILISVAVALVVTTLTGMLG